MKKVPFSKNVILHPHVEPVDVFLSRRSDFHWAGISRAGCVQSQMAILKYGCEINIRDQRAVAREDHDHLRKEFPSGRMPERCLVQEVGIEPSRITDSPDIESKICPLHARAPKRITLKSPIFTSASASCSDALARRVAHGNTKPTKTKTDTNLALLFREDKEGIF